MSGTRVRYSVGGASVGLDFGDIRFITEHTGMDKISYVDVRFEHGLLQMTSDDLGVLVRQGQQALATLPLGALPNCSGARAELEEA